MDTKAKLRVDLRARRASVTDAQLTTANEAVTAKMLSEVNWASVQSANIYASHAAWHELDTTVLVARLRQAFPAMSIDMPEITSNALLPGGLYDVIIVPVLGFDAQNYRLGLGSGWYDRFLAGQPQALKIGIAYDWARCNKLPREDHDIPLDLIITEQGLYRAH